jgi:hypothetical protein
MAMLMETGNSSKVRFSSRLTSNHIKRENIINLPLIETCLESVMERCWDFLMAISMETAIAIIEKRYNKS